MTNYVLDGLVKRRAELAGSIERTHDDLKRMIGDPDLSNRDDPRQGVPAASGLGTPRRDERVVFTILRQLIEPLTSRDIALELLTTRALDRNGDRA